MWVGKYVSEIKGRTEIEAVTRIFGHKQWELQEGGRTLHNAELYNLYRSLYRLICHWTS
jgi:hypothetical protein